MLQSKSVVPTASPRSGVCIVRALAGALVVAALVPSLARSQSGADTSAVRPASAAAAATGVSATQVNAAGVVAEPVELCVVPGSGTTYRVGRTGLPTQCLSAAHARLSMNVVGPQGLKGDSGAAGMAGPVGPAGAAGVAGADGAAGALGAAGVAGPIGPAGEPGPAGADGAAGAAGTAGTAGTAGVAGPAGVVGPAGAPGSIGPQGLQGLPGSSGVVTHSSLTGLSADDHPQYLLAGPRSAPDGFSVSGTLGAGGAAPSGGGTRLMWNPNTGALRAGTVGGGRWDDGNLGVNSVAFGENTQASGTGSFAVGLEATAVAPYSSAFGAYSYASGETSFAVNGGAKAYGAIAIGANTDASGHSSVALGQGARTSGIASVAIGNSKATALWAYALGNKSEASGQSSVAIGSSAYATQGGSVVISAAWNGGNYISETYSSQPGELVLRSTGGTMLYTDMGSTSGVQLLPGGGSWSVLSDRNRKDNFRGVDGESLLLQLRAIPVSSWNYKSQDVSIRHIGPMAQDWEKTFAMSGDSTSINSGDIAGVTLAGVQALDSRTQVSAELIAALQGRLASLESEVAELRAQARRSAHRVGRSSHK